MRRPRYKIKRGPPSAVGVVYHLRHAEHPEHVVDAKVEVRGQEYECRQCPGLTDCSHTRQLRRYLKGASPFA